MTADVSRITIRTLPLLALWLVPTAVRAGDPHGVVATVHPAATDAWLDAYRAGGNAVDAAVAAALTLGVVDNHNSGLGGGCFILIRRPDGKIVAIDGRERAPVAATRDMFVRQGKAQPELSRTGPLAIGVPGALAAYALAIDRCGQRTLAQLLFPAAEIADSGFRLDRVYARKLKATAKTLAKFEGSREALLKPDGTAYAQGELLRQPDLARSYRAIAEQGLAWFYEGAFAEAVGQWMADHGGVLTDYDLAAYEPVEREPIVTTYHHWTIVGFPPPSSGGVHVAQILNIVEQFDLRQEYGRDPGQAFHLIVEAMKLAFADRAHWLGDADFVDVPRRLIEKDYAGMLAARIDRGRASDVAANGTPPAATEKLFGKHTTHITAADTEGYWVAITATVNTAFGSKVIVPGTGIVLNNEMDDFSAQPGVPNVFGLLGAENNAVAPGKRPLSSMSPTIVLDADDNRLLTVGAAGGPKITTQVVLALIRCLDFDFELGDAVAAPRLHHQWRPDQVGAEAAFPQEILDALHRDGHQVKSLASGGVTQAIEVDDNGRLQGYNDPRVPGKAGRAVRAKQPVSAAAH